MNIIAKGVIPAFIFVLMGAGCLSTEIDTNPNTAYSPDEMTTNETKTQETMDTYSEPTVLPADRIEGKNVRIKTAKGDILIALYPDTAPLTVSNFVGLIEQSYYDGIIFHRREEGFVIQGGDPTGTGAGGPGYTFADELEDGGRPYLKGTLAMANRGPNTNGSQFFIMLGDVPLPKQYTIFGEVIEGLDVVDRIEIGDAMTTITLEPIVDEAAAGEVAEGDGFVPQLPDDQKVEDGTETAE